MLLAIFLALGWKLAKPANTHQDISSTVLLCIDRYWLASVSDKFGYMSHIKKYIHNTIREAYILPIGYSGKVM